MHGRPGSRFLLRLTLSYAAVSFTTIALIGIGIFWAFLNRYNHEIEALEIKLVEHTADAIHATYMESARTLYFRLATDELDREELSFFIDNELAGNNYRIIGIWLLLQDTLGPFGSALESVGVHYRSNQLAISSRSGVKFDVDDPLYDRLESGRPTSRKRAMAGFWRMDGETIEYVRQYPFTVASSTPALLSVGIPYERVAQTIRDLSAEHASIFLVDSTGRVVTPESYTSLPDDLEAGLISATLGAGGPSTLIELSSGSHILTAVPLEGSDWHLAKLTEVSAFYERSRATRNVLVIVAMSALSVCIFLSVLLARNQYAPVARIARMVTGLVTTNEDDLTLDADVDFAEMVKGLTRLSGEVDELRRSVAANRPLLRHQLVQSCLYGNIHEDAFFRRLKLLEIVRPVTSCRAIYLKFHQKQLASYEIEERSAIVYHTIDRVGEFQGTHLALASELGEDRIGILVLGSGPSGVDGLTIAHSLSAYLTNQFGIVHRIGIGSATGSPATCYISYHEATEAAESGFFLAKRTVAFEELSATPDAPGEISYEHRKQLVAGLHDRDRTLVERSIDSLMSEFSSGRYPAQSCRLSLSASINDVTAYAERMGHSLLPSEHRCLQAFDEEFVDVTEFASWLKRLIATIFAAVEDSARDARLIRMRRVQDYIQQHLQEPISLDTVADEFRITPSTLSRDFKSLNGVNFVDFVRESRLDRAQHLLSDTDLSVKEVADQSGYNSSSYFIQQFRRRFGLTPVQYRENIAVSNGA